MGNLKPQTTMTPTTFWTWFQHNQHKYYILPLLSREEQKTQIHFLEKRLNNYCKGLGFLMFFDNHYSGSATLIVTAYGVKELFPKVKQLVDCAPKMNNWNFEALIKPVNGNLIMQDEPYDFGSFKIKLTDLSFQTVKYIKSTGKIIIHIYFDKNTTSLRRTRQNMEYPTQLGRSNHITPKDLQTAITFILEDLLGAEYLYSKIKKFKVYKNNRNRGITYKLPHLKMYLDLINRN